MRSTLYGVVNDSGAPCMRTYELRFPDGLETGVERLQFEAANSARALAIAQCHKGARRMELWEDGRKLCDLRGSPVHGNVWIVRGSRLSPDA